MLFFLIFFSYTFIYAIISMILLLTNYYNLNININNKEISENSINIIKAINLSLIVLFALLIYSFDKYSYTEKYYKKRNLIKMIFIDIIHCIYERLIIWKLNIESKMIKNSTSWFIKMHIIFLILNFIYILLIIDATLYYEAITIYNYPPPKLTNFINIISVNDIILERHIKYEEYPINKKSNFNFVNSKDIKTEPIIRQFLRFARHKEIENNKNIFPLINDEREKLNIDLLINSNVLTQFMIDFP